MGQRADPIAEKYRLDPISMCFSGLISINFLRAQAVWYT
jgi:hypothetical protein